MKIHLKLASVNLASSHREPARRGRVPGCRRYTLVELIVALSLMSLVLAASAALYSFYCWAEFFVDSRQASVYIARNRIEELRKLSYSTLSYTAETDTRLDKLGNPVSTGLYYRTTLIQSNPALSTSTVSVTVRVPGRMGHADQIISLSSIILDRSQVVNLE